MSLAAILYTAAIIHSIPYKALRRIGVAVIGIAALLDGVESSFFFAIECAARLFHFFFPSNVRHGCVFSLPCHQMRDRVFFCRYYSSIDSGFLEHWPFFLFFDRGGGGVLLRKCAGWACLPAQGTSYHSPVRKIRKEQKRKEKKRKEKKRDEMKPECYSPVHHITFSEKNVMAIHYWERVRYYQEQIILDKPRMLNRE